MKIIRLRVRDYGPFTNKLYQIQDNIDGKETAVRLIQCLQENDVTILRIFVQEDAELDAKTVEGSYQTEDFLAQYDELVKEGIDVSAIIYCERGETSFHLMMEMEYGHIVFLTSSDKTLELTDLL